MKAMHVTPPLGQRLPAESAGSTRVADSRGPRRPERFQEEEEEERKRILFDTHTYACLI